MTKRPSTKWYVQEDQKIKGPYSVQEIQALLNEGKIRGKSLVSGGPKNNHSKTVNDLVKPLADPVYSLFNALQFAKNLTLSFSRELARTPLVRYQSKVGMLLQIGFALLLLLVSTIIYFDRKDYGAVVDPFQRPTSLPLVQAKPVPERKEGARPVVARRPAPIPIIQKPIEQKPIEQKPIEQKLIEQKPMEQKPIENHPERPRIEETSQNYDDYPPQPTPEPDFESNREPASLDEEAPIDPPIQPDYTPENPPEIPQPSFDFSE